MKVIKITAMWCSACLIMEKIFNEVIEELNIETVSLDFDFDEEEVKKYMPGNILPVFIFMKNNQERKRIVGEHSKEELIRAIKEIGE